MYGDNGSIIPYWYRTEYLFLPERRSFSGEIWEGGMTGGPSNPEGRIGVKNGRPLIAGGGSN